MALQHYLSNLNRLHAKGESDAYSRLHRVTVRVQILLLSVR